MFLKNYIEGKPANGCGSQFSPKGVFDAVQLSVSYLCLCMEINQERRALIRLTDSELRDVGLHPADVVAENRLSFFDVPVDRWNVYRKERGL